MIMSDIPQKIATGFTGEPVTLRSRNGQIVSRNSQRTQYNPSSARVRNM
jgi:hypothetical protein